VTGYAVDMTESSEQEAPKLGTPTDSDVGEQAVDDAHVDGEDIPSPSGDIAEAEKTMDTPDQLGGTGGEQAGGAG
jgi:hypothetical protein